MTTGYLHAISCVTGDVLQEQPSKCFALSCTTQTTEGTYLCEQGKQQIRLLGVICCAFAETTQATLVKNLLHVHFLE